MIFSSEVTLSMWLIISAPRIPKIDPAPAPIRRFRLAFSNRISKKTKNNPRQAPNSVANGLDRPKGCSWNDAAIMMITKIIRIPAISQVIYRDSLSGPNKLYANENFGSHKFSQLRLVYHCIPFFPKPLLYGSCPSWRSARPLEPALSRAKGRQMLA
ncbi:hypothetical protein SBA2_800033 [Acidobacteriia bacterium SbA2]|nr:hypothetical protein SBA2_800033 [Acidobacteriia bacterium SbA2]